jgi:NTP pyrophosphatase (non-canonical NTP hydrolase)
MEFDKYQEDAMSFRLPSADQGYAILGLTGEVGEFMGYLAKCMRDGQEPQMEHLCKELGDILWFVAAIADDLDMGLSEVAERNIQKLSIRKSKGTIQGSGDNR